MNEGPAGKEEMDAKVDEMASKAGDAAKNIGKKGLDAAGKVGKKAAKKAAKLALKAAKAALRAGAAAVKTIVAYGWPVLLVLLILLLIMGLVDAEQKNKAKRNPSAENGTIYSIPADWDERLTYSFYAYYADHSYYYVVDDETEIHQAGFNDTQPHDKGGRENSFSLSTSFLKYLDETLNGPSIMPEQFIKPIYSDCSTEKNHKGKCTLKQLTDDDGNLNVESQSFTEGETCKDGDDSCDADTWVIDGDKKVSAIWDYGLAPIIHYQKKEDASWSQDWDVYEAKYWDKENKVYKKCSLLGDADGNNKCPDDLIEEIRKQSEVKKRMKASKWDYKPEEIHLIDNVATFAGTISNEIKEETKDTGVDDFVYGKMQSDDNSDYPIQEVHQIDGYKKKLNRKKDDENDELSWIITVNTTNTVYYNTSDLEQSGQKKYVDEALKKGDGTYFDGTGIGAEFKRAFSFGNDVKKLTDSQIEQTSLEVTAVKYDGDNGIFKAFGKAIARTIIADKDGYVITRKYPESHTCKDVEITGKYTMKCIGIDGSDKSESFTAREECGSEGCVAAYGDGSLKLISGQSETYDTFTLKRVLTRHTTYSAKGDIWSTEFSYKKATADVDTKDSSKYIKDYINNYQYYQPVKNYMADFTFDSLKSIVDSDEEIDEKAEKEIYDFKNVLISLYGENIIAQRFLNGFLELDEMTEEEIKELDERDEKEEALNELVSEGEGIKRNESKYKSCQMTWKTGLSAGTGTNAAMAVSEAAKKFGLPANVLAAIACQESTFNHEGNLGEERFKKGIGIGVMQIEWGVHGGKQISGTTMGDAEVVTYSNISKNDVKDAKKNAEMGAMLLKSHMDACYGNILCAIYSYNVPKRANDAINAYADATGRTKEDVLTKYEDIGWYNSTYVNASTYKGGDKEYLTHVLSVMGDDKMSNSEDVTIEYTWNNKQITIDVSKLRSNLDVDNDSVEQYINWSANKDIISNADNWKKLYPNKPQDSAKITLKDNKVVNADVDYYGGGNHNTSQRSINTILAIYFAAQDGTESTNIYMEITDEMWREKFSSFFSTSDSDKVQPTLEDHGDYFDGEVDSPLKGNYVIFRPYGFSKQISSRNQWQAERYTDIIMKADNDTEVFPVAKGKIIGISDNQITIRHKEEEKDDKSRWVDVIYSSFKVDTEKLKIDDEVTTTTVIGKVDDDMLSIELDVNDIPENPTWILKLAKERSLAISFGGGDINPEAVQKANEDTKKVIKYLDDHADELEKKFKANEDGFKQTDIRTFDFIRNTFDNYLSVTGIAWTYSGRSGDTAHEAVDLAPSHNDLWWNTGVYMAGDGLLVSYQDGYPNTGVSDAKALSYYFGLANHIQVLFYGTDGNWYQVSFGHCLPGAEVKALSSYISHPILPKGTRIGTVGNSGSSTGAHTHTEVINLGKQSLKQITTQLMQNVDKWALHSWGVPGKTNFANRCENRAPICQEAPHKMWNLSHGGGFQGVVSPHGS